MSGEKMTCPVTKEMLLLLVLASLKCCNGYSLGPPLTACRNMTPGHSFAPQTIASPFAFSLNATTYRPGDVIEVFFNSSGEWFMEGTLIQMRSKESNCNLDVPAVGTFTTEENDVFLQEFSCFGVKKSALRHYSHLHIYNRTFYWKAPTKSAGNVYLSATIARNQEKFWLNVTSQTIEAVGDNPTEACGADKVVVTSFVLFASYLSLKLLS